MKLTDLLKKDQYRVVVIDNAGPSGDALFVSSDIEALDLEHLFELIRNGRKHIDLFADMPSAMTSAKRHISDLRVFDVDDIGQVGRFFVSWTSVDHNDHEVFVYYLIRANKLKSFSELSGLGVM